MRIPTIAVLICAVLCGTLSGATEPPRSVGQIAVLNLQQAVNNSVFYQAQRKRLMQQVEEFNQKLDAYKSSEDKMKSDLAVLKPGSAAYQQTQVRLELLAAERKISSEQTNQRLDREQIEVLRFTFKLVRDHLKDFSEERGIKLVHQMPGIDFLEADPKRRDLSLTELQLNFGLQNLLYYDPAIDITEPFLAYLNSKAVADQERYAKPADAPKTPEPAPAQAQP